MPGLAGKIENAFYRDDEGNEVPLAGDPELVRALALMGNRIERLQKGSASKPKSQAQGQKMNTRSASSIQDQIDDCRAQRQLALAQRNMRKVSELDERERQLWAQIDNRPVVGSAGRLY